MDKGLMTLLGMSIAYLASFLGLGLAWWSYRKRKGQDGNSKDGSRNDSSRKEGGR
jgi:hypothetical protein